VIFGTSSSTTRRASSPLLLIGRRRHGWLDISSSGFVLLRDHSSFFVESDVESDLHFMNQGSIAEIKLILPFKLSDSID